MIWTWRRHVVPFVDLHIQTVVAVVRSSLVGFKKNVAGYYNIFESRVGHQLFVISVQLRS